LAAKGDPMGDIACGKQRLGLEEFATRVNAAAMKQWPELGLYDPDAVSGWGAAFHQVMNKTLAAGGKVHFNLDGVDIADALRGDPNMFVGRYTEYELQQITLNQVWFRNTRFYLAGALLSAEQLTSLGVSAVDDPTENSGQEH
jgi:hypothetical protein